MSRKLIQLGLDDFQRPAACASVVILLFFFLAACGPATGPDQTVPAAEQSSGEGPNLLGPVDESAAEAGYPVQNAAESAVEEAYPVEPLPFQTPTFDPENYPPPRAAEEFFSEPRFRIDLPLNAENTLVTGQAPPNLALAIVNITLNGVILGSGVSDAEGRFSIGVQGLPDGHRVGITFSELRPGKTHADMSRELFPHRGEGFMNLPNVGIFFDTALVGP